MSAKGRKKKDGGHLYLQGDELFQDFDAIVVFRMLLDVGVGKECLRRKKRLDDDRKSI